MKDNYYKTIAITLFIFGIIFTIIGSTFAYFAASISSNGDNIGGKTLTFNASIGIQIIKNDELIPVADNLINSAMNSTPICTDVRGYGLCHIYKLTLTNSADAQSMTGSLKITSNGFTANHLKYQLFTYASNAYSGASDVKIVPAANGTSNFTLSNNDLVITLNRGTTSSPYTKDYYLVIWLSDPGSNQLPDSDKTYNGSVTFTSSGGSVTADFS